MRIVYLTKYYYPHIGGVEKHVVSITKDLISKDNHITVVTEKYDDSLKDRETDNSLSIIRIKYPHIKFIGLFKIWIELFRLRKTILDSDIIHIHDIFVWYLPFRFLYPSKKVVITFHGWEGKYPIPFTNILQKRIAAKLSDKTIAVGEYISKWYGIKVDKVIYGAVERLNTKKYKKTPNTIVFVGRLEKDTGLIEFLRSLKSKKYKEIVFVGDGSLKDRCLKYGIVTGFVDPQIYLQKFEFCVPSGYLSYLEARNYDCKVVLFSGNSLKYDYWKNIEKEYPNIRKTIWKDISRDLYKLYQEANLS